MSPSAITALIALSLLSATLSACESPSQRPSGGEMSFFVTSSRVGEGGNLGGLEGADAHCTALAAAVGSPKHAWRAYLSAHTHDDTPVHARNRIGTGPWFNAKGIEIAANVGDLHGPANNITYETALDEQGKPVSGRIHDMLTGSTADGTLSVDATCGDWTLNRGWAAVGHHNRQGGGGQPRSWNAAHTAGCRMDQLQALGGDARFYCFAAD